MYMTVIAGISEFHPAIPRDNRMQEVVKGYICTAHRAASCERPDITIDAYCNDEGLLMQLPIMHVRNADQTPIAGNLILVASNRDGETVPASQNELEVAYRQMFTRTSDFIRTQWEMLYAY